MTICRLYAEYGHRAGFWVQHRSWRDTCARIISVGGQRAGHLLWPAAHEDAEVIARVFDVRSGRPIRSGSRLDLPADKYYALIAEPSWYDPRRDEPPALVPAREEPT